jgi:hypothetical protein
MSTPMKSRLDLLQEWIRRVVAYTNRIAWFGPNSVARAIGKATAASTENAYQLYVRLGQRFSVLNALGDDLVSAAAEKGVEKLTSTNARVLVVIQPRTANVTNIDTAGANDLVEVDDSTGFDAAMEFVIRNQDASLQETATIIAITTGTGPNGGDELEVAPLVETYNFAGEDIDILAHVTIPARTGISTQVGVGFETLEAVTIGESNPVLDGEGTALALCDKVWCEALVRGASGNIEPLTVSGFTDGLPDGVRGVYNPERGYGGADTESDLELKARAITQPSIANIETTDWIEKIAKASNGDVLKAVRDGTYVLGSMRVLLLHRNGGGFDATEKADMATYIEARVRSYLGVELDDIELTSLEIAATLTLEADVVFETVWRDFASKVAELIDWRKWVVKDEEQTVSSDELYKLLVNTPGVATVDAVSFLPADDLVVPAYSVPNLTVISLLDATSSETINAPLTMSF